MYYNNSVSSEGAHGADFYQQREATLNRSESRIPICFCIDTSLSMDFLINPKNEVVETSSSFSADGQRVVEVRVKDGYSEKHAIDELRNVMKRMLQKMRHETRIAASASICMITFDSMQDVVQEFLDVDQIKISRVDELRTKDYQNDYRGQCRNVTNLAPALEEAMIQIRQYREDIKRNGLESYAPVLIVMSDGVPTDYRDAARTAEVLCSEARKGLISVIPIAIGKGRISEFLRTLTPDHKVYNMQVPSDFERVFDIITGRIRKVTLMLSADSGSVMAEEDTDDRTEEETMTSTAYGKAQDIRSFVISGSQPPRY